MTETRNQRCRGDSLIALQGRRKQIYNRPGLAGLVTELLPCLPMETENEVTHWVEKRFKGECRAPGAWKILRLAF